MAWVPDKLAAVAEAVKKGEQVEATPRMLLAWFGAQRRGYQIVKLVRNALQQLNLTTVDDFEYAYIDAAIRFVLRPTPATAAPPNSAPPASAPATSSGAPVTVPYGAISDPTYRVGKLESANRRPVTVVPDTPIEEAVTMMLANGFSQLPVMSGERVVKGLVSWKSIGTRLALGISTSTVRDCMDRCHEISADVSIFQAIRLVVDHDCVVIRDSKNSISGIVTTSDLSEQFGQLGEPFLLLGEIENHLRSLIDGKFTLPELESIRDPGDSARSISDVSDLTFGEYLRLIENEDRWSKLGLKIARKTFIKNLDDIRQIRNDIMHFDPDGIAPADLSRLRLFSQFLQRIQEITTEAKQNSQHD